MKSDQLSIFVFYLMINAANGFAEHHEISMPFQTNVPFCTDIPAFPDTVESNCTLRDYQSGDECVTSCLEEVVSTCSCLIDMGFGEFLLSFYTV